MIRTRLRRARTAWLVAVAALAFLLAAGPPALADSYVPVTGAGSTWSQVAVDAWRSDVRASGIVINYTGSGSTDGRSQFIQGTVDFANTEIPFQNPPEPGQQAEVSKRPFAYLPIVAGGTSFMYHLDIGGKRLRDLRLSGPTLAKIFTGAITNWKDPAITKDYGRQLPSIPIIPVIRSDGAGASAQFALYMRSRANDIYCPFIRSKLHLGGSACPSVSFYPSFGLSKAQVGSNGVSNYVAADYGQGAIGYVEYAYAKQRGFPVASLLNEAGYFAQPTAENVAVALTRARINSDLTQNLESVYTNPDPRTYPMSSYSYMIAPTTTASPFNADKGRTLSTFINYFLCAGQQKAKLLGYSPLPKNLVLAGFDQVRRIPGHVNPPDINKCDNPALRILQSAPQPDKCAKAGVVCNGGAVAPSAGPSSGTGGSGGTTGGTTTGGTGTTTSAGGAAGVTDPVTGGATGGGGTAGADPLTGAGTGATGTGATLAAGGQAVATPTELAAADRGAQSTVVSWLVALTLLLAVLVPPLVVSAVRRRT